MTNALTFILSMLSPSKLEGSYLCFNLCYDRSREATSYFQNQLCEPLLVDDGHGSEVLDQCTAHGNENWDTLDYEYLLGVSCSQGIRLKGSKEEIGGGESEGQGFCAFVTEGRQELASLYIGGPVPGEFIF